MCTSLFLQVNTCLLAYLPISYGMPLYLRYYPNHPERLPYRLVSVRVLFACESTQLPGAWLSGVVLVRIPIRLWVLCFAFRWIYLDTGVALPFASFAMSRWFYHIYLVTWSPCRSWRCSGWVWADLWPCSSAVCLSCSRESFSHAFISRFFFPKSVIVGDQRRHLVLASGLYYTKVH